jgi:hypothetical protein
MLDRVTINLAQIHAFSHQHDNFAHGPITDTVRASLVSLLRQKSVAAIEPWATSPLNLAQILNLLPTSPKSSELDGCQIERTRAASSMARSGRTPAHASVA